MPPKSPYDTVGPVPANLQRVKTGAPGSLLESMSSLTGTGLARYGQLPSFGFLVCGLLESVSSLTGTGLARYGQLPSCGFLVCGLESVSSLTSTGLARYGQATASGVEFRCLGCGASPHAAHLSGLGASDVQGCSTEDCVPVVVAWLSQGAISHPGWLQSQI